MATTEVTPKTEFDAEIFRIKKEIEMRFSELIARVKERERELLRQLEEISKEREKHQQSISELEAMLNFTQGNIHSEELKELKDNFVQKIGEKRKELECEHISLFWNDTTLLESIRRLGILDVTGNSINCMPVVDYAGKINPVVNIGTKGSTEGQLQVPWGVGIDYKSGNIYATVQYNPRVQVFDNEGRYLYKFGDIPGAGKMNNPMSIAITNDRVLVSQLRSCCVLVYDLKGKFIEQIGSSGNGNGQFAKPYGIAVNKSNGDIFVCEYANNRVQILSEDFSYRSQFAVDAPINVNVTPEHICVLAEKHPFLYIFNHNYTQVLQDKSASIAKHLNAPLGIFIDGASNFLISDHNKNVIFIFDKDGILLHKLDDANIHKPVGVSVDKKGRIVVVTQKPSLLIF